MIFILSSSGDLSTDLICWYLNYYKVNYQRINDFFQLNNVNIVIEDKSFRSEYILKDKFNKIYKILSKDKIFYRRGKLLIPLSTNKYLKETLIKEGEFIDEIFFTNVQNRNSDTKNNKILNLKLAVKCKLLIPKTIITNDIHTVNKEFVDCETLISKPITNSHINYFDENLKKIIHSPGVVITTKEMLSKNYFGFSLIQEYIEKKFEIRIFIYDDLIFSSAIFSQQNPKTKYDFRNYDTLKPNRIVPFNLPDDVKSSLFKIMKVKKLKTASFDLIFSAKNQYVFLEINPSGIFYGFGNICNFQIEKKIALKIKNKK